MAIPSPADDREDKIEALTGQTQLQLYKKMLGERKGLIVANENDIGDYVYSNWKTLFNRLETLERKFRKEGYSEAVAQEQARATMTLQIEEALGKARAHQYKVGSKEQRVQMLKDAREQREVQLREYKATYDADIKQWKDALKEKRRQYKEAEKGNDTEEMERLQGIIDLYEEAVSKLKREKEAVTSDLMTAMKADADRIKAEAKGTPKYLAKSQSEAAVANAKVANAEKRLGDAVERGDNDAVEKITAELKELNKEAKTANFKADIQANLTKAASAAIINTLKNSLSAVDNDITYIVSLRSPLMARLQGAEHSFSDMLDLVTKNLAVSPFVTQKAVLDKIKEAAEDGIAYNVEQRAFIASISDKLVSTFDAFDANIERMIRLQQADSTVARLGMEATLTRWLNGYFSDSSYLSSLFDSVSATILEATSLLSRDEALAMEYQTQKWLGALYSLGLSQQTVNTIAQGIAYLGTGNVQALAGNTQMQTLFAMAAARSGLPYANILLGGLNAEDTNTLLKAMVEYLRDIAANSANQVVKSSYGSIFNLSLADMKAISNLTDEDITSISNLAQSYSEAVDEAGRQMWDLPNRMSVGEMISTALANLSFTTAEGIANNPVTLALWQIVGMIQDATGGIPLPAVSIMGNMVDLSAFQVEQLLQLGMVGIGFLSNVGSVASSLGASTGMLGNLQAYWSGKEYLGRGQGNFISPTGASMGTSASGTVATSSSEDVANSAISEQTEDSEETAEITNKNVKPEHTFDEFYEAIFNEPLPITVRAGKDPVDGYFDWAHIAKSLDAFILDTYVPFTEALNANLFGNESTGFVKIITTTGEGFTNTGTALGTIDDSVVSLHTQTKDLFGDKSLVDNERLKVKDDGIDFSIFSVGGVAIGLLVKNIGDYIGSTNSSGLRGTSSDILKYMGTFQSPTTGASVLGRLHGIYGYAESIKKSIQGDGTGNIFKRLDDIVSYIGSTNSSGLRKQLGTIASNVASLGSSVSSSSSSSGVSTIAGYIGADASGNTTVRGLLKQIRDKDVSATINAQSISLSGSMTVSGITDAVLDRIVKKLTKMYTGVEAPTTGTVNRDAAEMVRREFFNGGFNAGKEDVGDSLQAIIYQLLYGVTKVQETDGTRKNPFVQQGTGNYVY